MDGIQKTPNLCSELISFEDDWGDDNGWGDGNEQIIELQKELNILKKNLKMKEELLEEMFKYNLKMSNESTVLNDKNKDLVRKNEFLEHDNKVLHFEIQKYTLEERYRKSKSCYICFENYNSTTVIKVKLCSSKHDACSTCLATLLAQGMKCSFCKGRLLQP